MAVGVASCGHLEISVFMQMNDAFRTSAITSMTAIVVSTLPMVVIASVIMMFLITLGIFAVVPIVLHKIHSFAAGVVVAAVFIPVAVVIRWNPHINRWSDYRSPID
jgi:hypothetical protein